MDTFSLQSLPVFLKNDKEHSKAIDVGNITRESQESPMAGIGEETRSQKTADALPSENELSQGEKKAEPERPGLKLQQEAPETIPPASGAGDQTALMPQERENTPKKKPAPKKVTHEGTEPATGQSDGAKSLKNTEPNAPEVEGRPENKTFSKGIVPNEQKTPASESIPPETYMLKKDEKNYPIPLPAEEVANEAAGPDRSGLIKKELPAPMPTPVETGAVPRREPDSAPAVSSPHGLTAKYDPFSKKGTKRKRLKRGIKIGGGGQKKEIGNPAELPSTSVKTDGAKEGESSTETRKKRISVARSATGKILTEDSAGIQGTGGEKEKRGGTHGLEKDASPRQDINGSGSDEKANGSRTAGDSPKKGIVAKDEKMGLGLPKPEPPADINIEIFLTGKEEKLISMYLLKRDYPEPEKRVKKIKKADIDVPIERKSVHWGSSGVKHSLSLLKADKGTFTFVIDNKATESFTASVVFHIYEGRPKGRMKEYKAFEMPPATLSRFKFILPDALFWDDEGRFSGEIESSKTKTKFLYESGLVWTEDKE